jgi:nicotinate phosphoribosyltransferase
MTPPIGPSTGTALLTDHYELTMLQAALASGTASRRCVFEVFARRLPEGRRYGVVAGSGRLLDAVREFRFGDDELAALERSRVVDAATLRWLAGYSFTGDVWGYGEGECFVPGLSVMVVEGHVRRGGAARDAGAVRAQPRQRDRGGGQPDVTARTGPPVPGDGVSAHARGGGGGAARAAYLAGFAGSSNLEAGRRYGVPTAGHVGARVHPAARRRAARVRRPGRRARLPDTDPAGRTPTTCPDGVRTAVEVAGPGLGCGPARLGGPAGAGAPGEGAARRASAPAAPGSW